MITPNYTFKNYLKISVEHKSKDCDFDKTLGLFKEWKAIEDNGDYQTLHKISETNY